MGYAQEYHVERYLRECFVPRIAPVSRVSNATLHLVNIGLICVGNDYELRWRKDIGSSEKLLKWKMCGIHSTSNLTSTGDGVVWRHLVERWKLFEN